MIEVSFVTADAKGVMQRHPWGALEQFGRMGIQLAKQRIIFGNAERSSLKIRCFKEKLTGVRASECNWVGS